MPIYCFQLPHPEPVQSFDLPGLDQARRTAVLVACAKISQSADAFWKTGEWQMSVTDELGLAQFSLTLFATEAPAVRGVEITVVPSPVG